MNLTLEITQSTAITLIIAAAIVLLFIFGRKNNP